MRPEDQVLGMHAFRDEEDGKSIAKYFDMDDDSCLLVLNGDDYEDVQCPKILTKHFMLEVTYTYPKVLN
jgi:hypothetical protein